MAIFFAKLSANTRPLFLVDLIFPCIRRIDMFVKPTRLIGKKEKGIIGKPKNEEKRKRAEKSEKDAKKRKQTGLTKNKGRKEKKNGSLTDA